MNRPRRTTEFHEDGDSSVLNKRQARTTAKTLVTPSPMVSKSSRETRIGRDSRFTLSHAKKSLIPELNHATPLHKRGTPGEPSMLLHADKKWVQEHAQQICEYLSRVLSMSSIEGVAPDLFARSSALRQLSIKQFLAIINFFFSFIWPNRVTVGVHFVDDIINALQKLRYPYAVQKSWLSTPTTQSSYGHVVVLLDFLKDFAPTPQSHNSDGSNDGCEFPFIDSIEHLSNTNQTSDDSITLSATVANINVLLDEEENLQFFRDSADGFMLWNNMKVNEFAKIKHQTANKLVKKRCNVNDVAALDAHIIKQQAIVQNLDEQIATIDLSQKEQQLKELHTEEHRLNQKLKSLREMMDVQREELNKLCTISDTKVSALKTQTTQLQELQMRNSRQKFTKHEFEELRMKSRDLDDIGEVYERQLATQNQYNENQQVELSRTKKQVLDKLEQYNAIISDMYYANICSAKDADRLMLSLSPQLADIEERVPLIIEVNRIMQNKIADLDMRRNLLEEFKANLKSSMIKVQSQIDDYIERIRMHEKRQIQIKDIYKTKLEQWTEQQQQYTEELEKCNEILVNFEIELTDLNDEYEKCCAENSKLITEAEEMQKFNHEKRTIQLDEYEEILEKAEKELEPMNQIIQQNKSKLELTVQNLKNLQLPVSDIEIV